MYVFSEKSAANAGGRLKLSREPEEGVLRRAYRVATPKCSDARRGYPSSPGSGRGVVRGRKTDDARELEAHLHILPEGSFQWKNIGTVLMPTPWQ